MKTHSLSNTSHKFQGVLSSLTGQLDDFEDSDSFKSPLLKMQLQCYKQRYSTRRQLGKLSDSQLADIGLTREQADREISKPFWH